MMLRLPNQMITVQISVISGTESITYIKDEKSTNIYILSGKIQEVPIESLITKQ